MITFCDTLTAIQELQKEKLLILLDRTREKEGDFFIPSQCITPQHISIMTKYGGGLICAAITREQANKLKLPLMVAPIDNTEKTRVNFTITVNAASGITTGVSSYDRAKTIRILADPSSGAHHLGRPGHVFGLVTHDGGLLKRQGHTEAAVDLSRLAGFTSSGVLCEIIGPDGRMATLPHLNKLAQKFGIRILPLDYLIKYLTNHPLSQMQYGSIVKTAMSKLPTVYGTFELSVYTSLSDNREHAVLSMGISVDTPLLVRIHSQCITGDTFHSLRCDCQEQLSMSMEMIGRMKSGIIVYLNQEGRGIGLTNKIKAYALQDRGKDTVEANLSLGYPADARDYDIAAEILKDLGVSRIVLLSNNNQKLNALMRHGIEVVERKPLEVHPHRLNRAYLKTKKKKLGHLLSKV